MTSSGAAFKQALSARDVSFAAATANRLASKDMLDCGKTPAELVAERDARLRETRERHPEWHA